MVSDTGRIMAGRESVGVVNSGGNEMINLFKSPLRRRIEAEITELNTLIETVEVGMKGLNRSINPNIYSKYWVKREDLRERIELLEKMLKK